MLFTVYRTFKNKCYGTISKRRRKTYWLCISQYIYRINWIKFSNNKKVIIIVGRQGFGPGNQEWGFVSVRPKAHMFWWLYYTTADVNGKYENKPLMIWLQGGPGGSSTGIGNFEEIGPLDVQMKLRNHSWVSMLILSALIKIRSICNC